MGSQNFHTSPSGASVYPLPDTFPLVFHTINHSGYIERVSDLWLATMGYERKDVVGRKSLEFLTEDSAKAAESLIKQLWKVGHIGGICHEYIDGNGETRPFLLSAALLKPECGKDAGAIAVLNPVESNPSFIDGLSRRSYRLQSCLEGMDAGTWEWNVQTGETIFNDRWAEIVGYDLAELSPVSIETWLSLAHPDDLKGSEAALKRHWAGETRFYDFEVRMRHKDGYWVWVHDRGRVCTWTEDGQPEWMFGTHFCIDEQRRHAAEREHMKRLLSRTGRVAGIGGWELDLETDRLTWTEETRRIHGVSDDFVPTVAKGIAFYAPEARQTITEAVNRGLQEGVPWDLELPFIKKSGERIFVRAVGEVEFEENSPRRIVGAFQDITERVNSTRELSSANAALAASNRELDQFAYTASHDLRAPLRVILNAARWLEEDIGEQLDDDSRENLALLSSRAKRMDCLLDSLLEYSRVGREGTGNELWLTGTEMASEIELLLDLPATARLVYSEDFLKLRMIKIPLLTILLNLVGNAIKHHDKPSAVVNIHVQKIPGDMLEFSVSDDGPGVEQRYHEKMFELFQTLKSRDEVEGSGMGLAIVKKHVEMSGGKISLVSSVGSGSTFTFTWPVAKPEIEQQESER